VTAETSSGIGKAETEAALGNEKQHLGSIHTQQL